MQYDGINSAKYTVQETVLTSLYTKFVVEIPGPKTKAAVKEYFLTQTNLMKKLSNNA